MANVNGIINRANEKAMKVIEDEVVKTVGYVEEEVLTYYLEQLAPLYQAMNILYEGLEKENFTKFNRKDFEEIVEETFNVKITMVMKDYLNNSTDMALNIGKEQYSEEFGEYMKQYHDYLYKQGVSKKRIHMEGRKLQYTMSRRFVVMLNSLADNMNKEFLGCCEYLLNSMEFFKQHYTIDVDAPKAEDIEQDIEVEIEQEGYVKTTDRHELEELALANGFKLKRVTGSHHIYENAEGKITVIPMHSTDIGLGLSHAIQKQILV